MTPDAAARPSHMPSPIDQLDELGPNAARTPWPLAEARRYVHDLTHGANENFHVLSRFIPAHARPDFAAVYAYCRWSDDLADEAPAIDGPGGPASESRAPERLRWWRGQLEACFQTDEPPTHPVFAALRETAQRHGLPIDPFANLLDAFDQDQRVTRYETWDQLLGYCRNSANPVGRIVLMLAGHRPSAGPGAGDPDPASADLERLSDDVCTGLQLVNFWQDVRRDLLDRDRVYLPSAETGLDADTLRAWIETPNDPAARVPYIKAVRALLRKTTPLFDSGDELVRRVNPEYRRAIWLFAAGGRAIARKIDRTGCTTLWRRPTLSKLDKLALLARAQPMR